VAVIGGRSEKNSVVAEAPLIVIRPSRFIPNPLPVAANLYSTSLSAEDIASISPASSDVGV